jgi:predicted lipoprotein with Yx(FWY)xxD motif
MKNMNHLGIDVVVKRKCGRAALKDDKGMILDEFFFGNDKTGYAICFQQCSHTENVNVPLKSSLRIYMKHADENS